MGLMIHRLGIEQTGVTFIPTSQKRLCVKCQNQTQQVEE